MKKAIFEGLVFDPLGRPLEVGVVGDEIVYILDDDGFFRHISAELVDKQVWEAMTAHIDGNEEMLSEEAAKMMGQDDIFTVAIIRNQLENKEKQFEALQLTGLPEDGKVYLGMAGFRIIIDHHGDILELHQPGIIEDGTEE